MSSTPRAKPVARPASPRPSPRASAMPAAKPAEKKLKAKKPKASPPLASSPTDTVKVSIPSSEGIDKFTPDQLKAEFKGLSQKYSALIVNYNNQQTELQAAQKRNIQLDNEVKRLTSQLAPTPDTPSDEVGMLRRQLQESLKELRSVEELNMTLQKKVNKLQVEHVSEEEVDQLFYALEVKDHELAEAQRVKEGLEQEILTARQLTARGTNYEPKFIEIHHHNTLSDDDDSDSDDEDEKGDD